MLDLVPVAPEIKVRVNTCFYPSVLAEMDSAARALGISRSELLEYAFRFWLAAWEAAR